MHFGRNHKSQDLEYIYCYSKIYILYFALIIKCELLLHICKVLGTWMLKEEAWFGWILEERTTSKEKPFHLNWRGSNRWSVGAIRAAEMAPSLTFCAGNGWHLWSTTSYWLIQVIIKVKTKWSTFKYTSSFTFWACYHPQIATSLAHTQSAEYLKVKNTAQT